MNMSWDDILCESDWKTLPRTGGAIGDYEGLPCVLRTGPQNDRHRGRDVHEAHCEQVIREAEELCGAPINVDDGVWHTDDDLRETFVRLPRYQARRRLPRWPNPREIVRVGLDNFIVTDDELEIRSDHRSIWDYNCLGFCLGRKEHVGFDGDCAKYLEVLGFEPDAKESDSGTVVALYKTKNCACHVVKHLRDGWYESKCGQDGIRIAHRLVDTWGTQYGQRQPGLWRLTDETKHAAVRMSEALPIEDSASEYREELWRLIRSLSKPASSKETNR